MKNGRCLIGAQASREWGMEGMTELVEISGRFRLTQRETDVLRHMLKGLKNASIADRLKIAEQTVKDHLSKIYRKIGVENKFELMHSLVKTSNEKLSALSKNSIPFRLVEEKRLGAPLTDETTGLYNRRGFSTLVEHYVKLARRQRTVAHGFLSETRLM